MAEVVSKTAPGPSIDEVFVDAVRRGDGSKILSPYSDAVKSLAISLAAIQSSETGATGVNIQYRLKSVSIGNAESDIPTRLRRRNYERKT